MLLRERSREAEYFDAPERTAAELDSHYEWLDRINHLTRFERPFRIWIPQLLGDAACRRLEILDVGAGQGSLGRCLTAWAASRGWEWTFADLDLSAAACARNPNPRAVTGSAAELPYPDRAFDVVIANTMTHHLPTDETVIAHFREASRVARRLVLICDMQRQLPFLVVLGLLLWVKRVPKEFRQDGLLSVRRGWRLAEWRRLADAAGLERARVWTEHGSRILLAEVKAERA